MRDDIFKCPVLLAEPTGDYAQLNKADFTQARLQTSSKTNMLRVVYGNYNSQEEAIDTLRQLRKQSKQFSNAWVMENK